MKTKTISKTIFLLLIISSILNSCSTYKIIKNKNLVQLKKNIEAQYLSKSTFIDSIKTPQEINIQSLFRLNNKDSNCIVLIDSNSDLIIKYKNVLGGVEQRSFKGKFRRKYFEIYLEKKLIPFAPIYGLTSISRLRIALDKKNNLIIDHYENHSGVILLMAGGSSNKEQFSFKQITNL